MLKEKEENSGLASQGEFLIGAGNTALVTTVVSAASASLVFSKSAQPTEKANREKNMLS